MVPQLELREPADRERIRSAQSRLVVRLTEPALPKRLGDKLHRFKTLRHKAVHWLAPVPAEATEELLEYLRTLLLEGIPPAVERLTGGETPASLSTWIERLQAAARGSVPAACQPLLTQALRDRVSICEDGRPARHAGGDSREAEA
jgi:hypothetical protein